MTTEFVLSAFKILGLCLAFAMALLQERQHSKKQATNAGRRATLVLLALGLLVAVGAEVADLFNRHQGTSETLKRHEQILVGLERTTHPFFPVGISSEFQLPLSHDAEAFRGRLEEAIKHHDSQVEPGTKFSVQGEAPFVRFTSTSRLFPTGQERTAKAVLEAPIGLTVRVGDAQDVASSSGRLIVATFQVELPEYLRVAEPRALGEVAIQEDMGQYKTTVFEYRPGRKQVTAILREVTLSRPASSDGSIVSTKDVLEKKVRTDVSSPLRSRPALERVILRFGNQETIEFKPKLEHSATDAEVDHDTYAYRVPKRTN